MSEYSTPMSCFMGTYLHSLDSKGRLTVPRRFREGFSAGGMITRGIDSCLEIMPTAAWAVKAERVANLDEFRREGRNARRALFANAAPLEFDKQGRISIPAPLREMVGIAKDVAVVGAGERVEIWCAQQWAAQQAELRQRLPTRSEPPLRAAQQLKGTSVGRSASPLPHTYQSDGAGDDYILPPAGDAAPDASAVEPDG